MINATRILIVEDLPTDADLAMREVRRVLPGSEFLLVETRETFLAALESFAPDLILADYRLPQFDGLSALKLALENLPETPFIIITGSSNEDTAVDCMRAGAWDYVIKEHIKRLGPAVLNGLEQRRLRHERKRVEAALQESEARLRFALQVSHTGAWELNLVDNSTNRTLIHDRIFGYETLLPRWTHEMFLEHVLPEDRPEVSRRFREATASQEDLAFECRIRRADGETRWIWAAGGHERSSEGKPVRITGILQDITERKQAEERVERLNECLSHLGVDYAGNISRIMKLCGELLGATYAMYNRLEGDTIRSLGQWNTPPDLKSVDSRTGSACADVIERNSGEVTVVRNLMDTAYAESDLNVRKYGLQTYIGQVVRSGSKAVGALCVVFQRAYEPSEGDKRIIGILTSALAAEEIRRQAQEFLAESEERHRVLFEGSHDALMTLGSPSWNFTSCNRATVDMFRVRDAAEFTSLSPWLLSPEKQPDGRESAEKARSMIETALREGSHFFEWTHSRADGATFPAEVLLTRMERGGLAFLQATVRDITGRKHAEDALLDANMRLRDSMENLQRTQQQVIQQERLKALGGMVSGIVHDFNNNLMPIVGFSDFMISDPSLLDDRADAIEMLEKIRMAAKDARETVRRLREFYKPDEELAITRVDLKAQIAKVVELTMPAWKTQAEAQGKMIRIETDMEHLPLIPANGSQLREVLANLVINAVHAMPEGGLISLTAGMRGDEWVFISVRDTGIGMTEEVKRRCFEPFFTTKGSQGTGLGLAMCYGIVQRHGGRLEVESEDGKGTTMTILLPTRGATFMKQVEPEESVPVIRGLRVLVVDDDLQSGDLIRRLLERDGQTVVLCASAQEAIGKAAAGKFELVITDRAMPEMNGEQLAEAIKTKYPGMPVIMLTGFDDMSRSVSERVDFFMEKPTTVQKLREAVAMVIQKGRERGTESPGS